MSARDAGDPRSEPDTLRRRVERERKARLEAEAIAERVTRELYTKAELMQLLQRVAAGANEAATAEEALTLAVTHVCKSMGWPVGHVYRPLLDGSGVLVPTDIWYLDDPHRFEAFRDMTGRTVLAPGVGLPGRVAKERHPAWVPDVTADKNFPRAPVALASGIRAGVAFPVVVGAQAAFVLEFFATHVAEPNPELLDAMVQIGSQLGRVVERERGALALRESEHAYRLLAENVTDVIFVYDMQLRATYISPSAERLRGYTVDEMMGQSLADRLTPASLERAMRLFTEIMADPATETAPSYESRTVELEVTCKDGSTKWTETQMSFIRDTAGRPVGILGIARDITDRRAAAASHAHLEEQLRQAQKMEAIGRLAGGVAHDFNNLLTVITGRTSLLLDIETLGERERRDLEMVLEAGERAAGLTRQLLAFSRKQILQPRVLDLSRVVEEFAPMLRRVIGEDIQLTIAPGAQGGGVLADRGQLEQVVMNLVVNARDAMPRGGRVTVEIANVDLDETFAREHVGVQPGPYVLLSVNDTGVGMDAATRARIFEPFFTTKPEGQGTGLGLATVFGIVAQSGGTIWVDSEPGRGTTFTIYLPRVQSAGGPAVTVAAAPAPRGRETVLFVEDDDGVRFVGEDSLRRLGYVVLAARNGEDALRVSAAHDGRIAILVSDVVMPGMSGPDLHARLVATRPEMKVLFLSGYAPDAAVRHGFLDPAVAFLEKPFGPEALARKVREALDASG